MAGLTMGPNETFIFTLRGTTLPKGMSASCAGRIKYMYKMYIFIIITILHRYREAIDTTTYNMYNIYSRAMEGVFDRR